MSPARRVLGLVPGVIVLGAIGYAGKFTEQTIAAYGKAHLLTLPNIEYVLWAIVFGLIVSNTVGVPAICEAGIETYEFWLKSGIVLLGVRFVLGDIARLGGVSLACVIVELAASIAVMTALGRAFNLRPKLTSLLSIGASICGVSAIIAAKGAIEADDEDASYAIAAILALGAGLNPPEQYLNRFPHELSGGQRQRVAIAASIVLDPELLVADEPVSMLDVSVRAGVLSLLGNLRRDGELAILMITHDLSTAAHFADRIAVMYLGRIVEEGPAHAVVRSPQHPYTKALVGAVPARDPREHRLAQLLTGEPPDAVAIPAGCRFQPRCRCRAAVHDDRSAVAADQGG